MTFFQMAAFPCLRISTKMEIKYYTHEDNDHSEDNINTLNIYTDGSVIKVNKQNRAGCGFVIYKNGTTIKEQAISLGTMATINQCEMIAIREGVEEAENLLNNIYKINFHTGLSHSHIFQNNTLQIK